MERNDRSNRNSRPSDDNREMFDVVCSECGKETKVPFQPDGERPVYCRDCFAKHRPARNDRGQGFRRRE